MPWCPKCRNEYRAGFTVCADCGVELVDQLGEEEVEKTSIVSAPIEEAKLLYEFLEASSIQGVSLKEHDDGTGELFVEDKHQKEATFAIRTYLEKRREEMEEKSRAEAERIHREFGVDEDSEDEDDAEEYDEDDEDEDEEEDQPSAPAFRSSKEKADEARSSAFALIIGGVLGLTFEALVVFHVLPLQIKGVPGMVLYGFLAVVFLFLVISGIMSIFTAKRLRKSIVDESHLKEELLRFCKYEAVDTTNKMIPEGSLDDESIYFARVDFLKGVIKREPKFKDVEDATIDALLDENYQDLFG